MKCHGEKQLIKQQRSVRKHQICTVARASRVNDSENNVIRNGIKSAARNAVQVKASNNGETAKKRETLI